MKRLTRALAIAVVGTAVALAAPVSAGDLSVSIVGDGYIVNPGPGGEVIYYGPPQYAAPPVVPYGYGYGYPPPAYYGAPYGAVPYGYYAPPPVYAYGGLSAGYAQPWRWGFGRRALRFQR